MKKEVAGFGERIKRGYSEYRGRNLFAIYTAVLLAESSITNMLSGGSSEKALAGLALSAGLPVTILTDSYLTGREIQVKEKVQERINKL